MHLRPTLLLIALSSFAAPPLAAQNQETRTFPPKQTHRIAPATSRIVVDAVLDEQAWKDASRIEIPWEWNPADNAAAPVSTETMVTFDENMFYVAFVAHDPDPNAIRARYMDRDSAFLDDTVGFVLDTFNDQRRGFQFRVNPLGVQMEATNSDVDGSEDWSWDIIWNSAGRITSDGYIVEVAIPIRQLRFPRTSGPQTWGFLAMRDYPRNVRHRLRSTWFNRSRNCFICQSESIVGMEGFTPGRNLEVTPTLTGTQTDARESFPRGPLESGSFDLDGGVSTRWGITPNATLNATINPDFSQVEADAAQLNVNERFALFFPEKRPFFLEGSDYFSTPLRTVFTRTIADPSAGLKLTGKEGSNVFGVLLAQDEINNLLFPGFQSSGFASIKDDVSNGIARYRRDIGTTSTIGALYTGRVGNDYSNHLVGIDGHLRPSQSDTIRFQLVQSSTEYPDSVALRHNQPLGSFGGLGGALRYNHSERNWSWFANYSDLDTDFRADSGFISRVGYRGGSAGIERILWGKPGNWYNQLRVFVGVDATQEKDGQAEEWGSDVVLFYQGPLQSVVRIGFGPNREYYRGTHYHNERYNAFFEITPTGDFSFNMFANVGETIDFANARQGEFVFLRPGVDVNLGRRFQAGGNYTWNTLDVEGGQLFEANLLQARMLYHFNLQTYVRLIMQYRDVERNPDLYRFPVSSDSENLFSQFLFSYKLNPQTVALIGYSDNYFGDQQLDLTQADRTFFIKLGYAWLF